MYTINGQLYSSDDFRDDLNLIARQSNSLSSASQECGVAPVTLYRSVMRLAAGEIFLPTKRTAEKVHAFALRIRRKLEEQND